MDRPLYLIVGFRGGRFCIIFRPNVYLYNCEAGRSLVAEEKGLARISRKSIWFLRRELASSRILR
jgi:hypothetical protein